MAWYNAAMLTADVRHRVYRACLETGAAPAASDLARDLNTSVGAIEDALTALEAEHAMVLAPATRDTVWMAHPFSNVITDYRVVASDHTWWANCAWDTFGIASLLSRDVEIHSRCACCGDPITLTVRDGVVHGQALVHFVVPPRRFWDNVGYT